VGGDSATAHTHGTEPEPHTHEPVPEQRSGMTGFALAKYGIILVIVLVVLWFVATYFLGS
jgi:cell division septal protein FtsQ